jgi:hypothetical protein
MELVPEDFGEFLEYSVLGAQYFKAEISHPNWKPDSDCWVDGGVGVCGAD